MKIEIISTETIKPTSPTPHHLRTFKLSLVDQLAPALYVPIVLFYSAEDFNRNNVDHNAISDRLKKSLSETLTLYFPFAGTHQGNDSVECDDNGVTYKEARVNTDLSEILENPDMDILKQFLPCDPYNLIATTAIQVNIFECGGIGIGICISHMIADGTSVATFLTAWSAASIGAAETIPPCFDSALHFPHRDHIEAQMPKSAISKEKTVTKRFQFDAKNLALLRAKMANAGSISPTRVEIVTSLIWKSAMAVNREKAGKTSESCILTHVVNIRGRMEPPMPEHSVGNLWQFAVVKLPEEESKVELNELVGHLRKAIKKIDGDYMRKVQEGDGILNAFNSMKDVHELVSKGEVDFYRFSSWSRFPFYKTDFGFGKPIWVCTTNHPIKNVVILMGTRSGDGIEAWVTLTEHDMEKFESNDEILEFTSSAPSS